MISRRRVDLISGQLPPFTQAAYSIGRLAMRGVKFNTLQINVIRPETAERNGGYILAPTHLSHLEPFILSMILRRRVDWMTRIEFYDRWWKAMLLHRVGTFPVRRQGVPISAIRTAIARLRQSRVVGIFPEGGVANGSHSACRGGPIKHGACLISYRANVPVIPCAVVGTHELNCVKPWIPFRRATLWIAFGEPLWPDLQQKAKPARLELAARMRQQYQSLLREIVDRFRLDEQSIP